MQRRIPPHEVAVLHVLQAADDRCRVEARVVVPQRRRPALQPAHSDCICEQEKDFALYTFEQSHMHNCACGRHMQPRYHPSMQVRMLCAASHSSLYAPFLNLPRMPCPHLQVVDQLAAHNALPQLPGSLTLQEPGGQAWCVLACRWVKSSPPIMHSISMYRCASSLKLVTRVTIREP